ncbi:MAG TPA: hypothetical protein VGM32_19455, partial [Rhodopila sp.]
MNSVDTVEAASPVSKPRPTHMADGSAGRPDRPSLASADGQSGRAAAIAFISDDATEAALRGGLIELMGDVQIHRGGIRAACRALQTAASPRVLVVDVSGTDDPIRELDALAVVCEPDTKVLVIGERTDIEFYREVTRHLGIDEYLTKP